MGMTTEIQLEWVNLMHDNLSSEEWKVQMRALQGMLRIAEEKAEFLELGYVLIHITSAIEKLEQILGNEGN
jgi:hydrogenase maturation factor